MGSLHILHSSYKRICGVFVPAESLHPLHCSSRLIWPAWQEKIRLQLEQNCVVLALNLPD